MRTHTCIARRHLVSFCIVVEWQTTKIHLSQNLRICGPQRWQHLRDATAHKGWLGLMTRQVTFHLFQAKLAREAVNSHKL